MKKGFTLIELLAVIGLLAAILIIAVPQILDVVENARIKVYQDNELMMEKAAETYLAANRDLLPRSIGNTVEVTLDILETNEYISSISDTYGSCDGYILVTKTETGYSYNPELKCGDSNTIGNSLEDGLFLSWSLNKTHVNDNNMDSYIHNYYSENENYIFTNDRYFFNGNSGIVATSEASNHSFSDLTISAWIKTSGSIDDNNYDRIVYNWLPGFILSVTASDSNNGKLRLFLWDDIEDSIIGITPITDDKWHYVAASFSLTDNTIKLYVDGFLDNSKVTSKIDSLIITDSKVVISNIGNYTFRGLIGDVRIYERRLSNEEIKYQYNVNKSKYE